MYHGKRSPYRVKVKTKRAKLYKIKREDFSDICESYKNIIKRIHKKEILPVLSYRDSYAHHICSRSRVADAEHKKPGTELYDDRYRMGRERFTV